MFKEMNLSSTQTTVGAVTRFGVGCIFNVPQAEHSYQAQAPETSKSRHLADEGPLVELGLACFVLKLCRLWLFVI